MDFCKEKKFILRTIGDFINSQDSQISEVDWSIVLNLACAHQVETIIFYQHKEHIAKSQFDKFKASYYAHLSSILDRREALDNINKTFNQNNIDYLIFKGFDVMQYYPKPELRTMGDCDILVRQKSLFDAKEALASIGFTEKSVYFETVYSYKKLMFELHFSLLYDEIFNSDADKNFCEHAWDNVDLIEKNHFQLDANFHLVYLLLHLKKHLSTRGAGLRQFLDIYLFSKNAKIDNDKLLNMLSEVNLNKFYHVCMSLCNRWFMNKDDGFIDDKFYNLATEQVFNGGVFGFNNNNKDELSALNRTRKYGRFGALRQYAFPSYANIKEVEAYHFVDGKPYLLPAAWIYRLLRLVKNKNVNLDKKFVKNTISNTEVQKYENTFQSWGI